MLASKVTISYLACGQPVDKAAECPGKKKPVHSKEVAFESSFGVKRGRLGTLYRSYHQGP